MKTPINSIGALFYFFSISSNVFFLSLQTVKLIPWRLFRYLLCVHFLWHLISCPILVISYILNGGFLLSSCSMSSTMFHHCSLDIWGSFNFSSIEQYTFNICTKFVHKAGTIFLHFLLIVQYILMSPLYSRVPWFCSEPRCRSSTVSCYTNNLIYRNSILHIHYQRETPNSRKIKTSRSLL